MPHSTARHESRSATTPVGPSAATVAPALGSRYPGAALSGALFPALDSQGGDVFRMPHLPTRDPMQAKTEPALRLATSERAARDATPRLRLTDDHVERNPGTALDLDVVRALRVNRSAVERRAATIPTRRTVKKEWQAAWLLRAITLMDLTTLAGDDTPGNVRRLCAKARTPVRDDLLDGARRRGPRAHDRRGVRLPRHGADRRRGAARARGIPGRRGDHGLPGRPEPARAARRARSARRSRRARARSTSSSRARTCYRQLAGALRRGARCSARRAATRT